MRDRVRALRPWLAVAGVLAAAVVLLPPVATLARQYQLAEAVQFAVLAVVVPALVVLGAPWRLNLPALSPAVRRTSSPGQAASRPAASRPAASRRVAQRLADRLALARSHRRGGTRAWVSLAGFIVVALAWRLPVAGDALVRHPILVAGEALTLIPAGCALWLELVGSPPFLPRTSRPQRALLAALSMWSIWAAAYIQGFAQTAWFSALAHSPGHGIGTIADQEIAAGLLWAIPGLCFVPVVYFSLITWLRDSADLDEELREVTDAQAGTGLPGPRPPRGWR